MINQLGIIKGGLHSYADFGLIIKSKKIYLPSKNKIELTVPFMDGSYDFSGIYGEQTYSDRPLEYVFYLSVDEPNLIEIYGEKVINWLLDGYRSRLEDDELPRYYFMAECVSADYKVISCNIWEITASFKAYPYKIGINYEGHDLWDEYSIEDYAQPVYFSVHDSISIMLYNPSVVSVAPSVICSNTMTVTMNDTRYTFKEGMTKDHRFKLQKGENQMTVQGNGTIEFKFRKEVL